MYLSSVHPYEPNDYIVQTALHTTLSAAVEFVGAAHVQLIVSHALSVSVPRLCDTQTKLYLLL